MAKTADFQALFSIQGGFCDIFVKSARISNNYLKNNKTYVKIIKRKSRILTGEPFIYYKRRFDLSKTVKTIIAVVVIAVLGIGIYYWITTAIRNNKEVSDYEFVKLVEDARGDGGKNPDKNETDKIGEYWDNEQIVKIHVDGFVVYGYTSVDAKNYTYWATFPAAQNNNWFLEKRDAWIEEGLILDSSSSNPNAGSGWTNFVYIAILVVGVVAFFIILRATSGGGGKVMNFGKTKAKVSTNLKVRFSDVAGAEEEKEELKEVVEFLRNPKKFSDLGAKIPKGVLLVGPPGTGKTLFAKAVAGEAGVPFFSVSGSDFVEMYVGVGASRVRDLFDLAKRNQPCIIFIDEIDAVGRQRGAGLGGGHDEREQTLNQILVQMDGFDTNEGIIVMAATNRADILDSALLRPGRFDRQIYVNLPDVRGREQILKVHSRNKPLAADVNFKVIARITSGFSGADLANLLNEAAILAARAGRTTITNHDLYEGINKVIMGPQKKSRVVTEADKKNTAYHEAGHAILAKLCPHCDEVQEVSIIPRGMAAGYTLSRPETDDRSDTINKLNDDICMALGGRVAEELVIHDFSAGASGDIQHITSRARKMVTEWGMSEKLGPIAYGSSGPVFLGRDYEERTVYSEETAAMIDEEIKRIISTQYERAKKLLSENRSVLDNMARVLVERETIYTAEVNLLMKGASYAEVLEYMEEHDKGMPDEPFGAAAPQTEGKTESAGGKEKEKDSSENQPVDPVTETETKDNQTKAEDTADKSEDKSDKE
ncbi:MAG: ATP-dependent zinc metalloprotease FtsH [Clostridia bacterium]|nr:ATP-dependent zinc metalloprotease FtsH [Clostridia bacterium]